MQNQPSDDDRTADSVIEQGLTKDRGWVGRSGDQGSVVHAVLGIGQFLN